MDKKTKKDFVSSVLGIIFFGLPICELAGLQMLGIIFSVSFISLFVYRCLMKTGRVNGESDKGLFDDLISDFESENKAMDNGYCLISLISEIVLPINSILWIRPLGIIVSIIYLVSTVMYLALLMHYAISNFKKGRF